MKIEPIVFFVKQWTSHVDTSIIHVDVSPITIKASREKAVMLSEYSNETLANLSVYSMRQLCFSRSSN